MIDLSDSRSIVGQALSDKEGSMAHVDIRLTDAEFDSWTSAAGPEPVSTWARNLINTTIQAAKLPSRDLQADAPVNQPKQVPPVKDVPKVIYDAVAAHMLGRDQRAINIAAKRTEQELAAYGGDINAAIAGLGWMTKQQVDALAEQRAAREPKVLPRIWADRT